MFLIPRASNRAFRLNRVGPGCKRFGQTLIACLFIVGWTGASGVDAPFKRDALFHIERSKNANIVQYVVQVGSDGKLHPRRPVVVYWVRLAEQGQEKRLSWIQKTFAYGFDASLGPERETVELRMVAGFGRSITVQRDGDDYKALARIDGEPAWLERIYVQSSKKGLSKNIDFVDLFGTTVADGTKRRERLTP